MFLDDVKAYLSAAGFTDIYRDAMPDQPDACIGLFLWAHRMPIPSDGTCTRYVQVQVRRMDPDDANETAQRIMPMLDSGMDETKIYLTPERWCVARPLAVPKKLSADESGRTTYYFEVSLFGENTP